VHVIGVLFLVNAATAAAIGATLLLSGNPWVVAAAIGFAATTLVAFLVSVYHGLFGYVESLNGPWQLAAGAVEIATIALLAPTFGVAVRKPNARVPRLRRQVVQAGTDTVARPNESTRSRRPV
jgi:hypothetical protein